MVATTVTVINKMGFHMRPASVFVRAMGGYESTLTIYYGDLEINGKSIMNVMASCIKCGAELRLQCQGPDEAAMLQEAAELIRSGMGE